MLFSSVRGGETTLANPLGCWGTGLSSESGRELGSASRGDAFSVTDSEGALGECAWKAAGFGLAVLDEIGMLETCERKAEKEGTEICANELCFRAACGTCAWDVVLLCEAPGRGTEPLVSEEERECV